MPVGGREKKRSEAVQEMFNIPTNELPMKTNTPRSKLEAFVLMEVVEYGLSTRGKSVNGKKGVGRKRLSAIYRVAHDRRMISVGGKGRDQLTTILSTEAKDTLKEFQI